MKNVITINDLSIEQMREIVSGAPSWARAYNFHLKYYTGASWFYGEFWLDDLRAILDAQPKFKIGDQVVFVDTERFTDDLLDIKYHKENGKFVVTNGWVSWKVDEEEIRHATAEEIKAGYTDHCTDIRNHVSPNCEVSGE